MKMNWAYQEAENAQKFYKGYKGKTQEENYAFYNEFDRLKSISMERKIDEKFQFSDICMLLTH